MESINVYYTLIPICLLFLEIVNIFLLRLISINFPVILHILYSRKDLLTILFYYRGAYEQRQAEPEPQLQKKSSSKDLPKVADSKTKTLGHVDSEFSSQCDEGESPTPLTQCLPSSLLWDIRPKF